MPLRFEAPAFDAAFETALTNLETSNDYSEVVAESLVYPGVSLRVVLHTEVADDDGNLKMRDVSVNFVALDRTARARFISASLYAMLSLAGPIKIRLPSMNLDLE